MPLEGPLRGVGQKKQTELVKAHHHASTKLYSLRNTCQVSILLDVEINSGRKQIIDIFVDKKVIDDRIDSLIVMKKRPLLRVNSVFSFFKLNGRTSFDKNV